MSARRAQLLSLDAMVSLVIVIFVFTTVINTSSALKGEITSMLGWYERANIADNMLDVMVKTPGEPTNWYQNPDSVKIVGIGSNYSPTGADYRRVKALALNFDKPAVLSALNNMSMGKDFLLEFYLSSFNVSIDGRFPIVYIPNITFADRRGTGLRFDLQGSPDGNDYFSVSYIKITKANGSVYINENITALSNNGQNIEVNHGDIIEIVTASTTYLTTTSADIPQELCNEKYSNNSNNNCVIGPLPENTRIIIYLTNPESNLQIQLETKWDWKRIRLAPGQGNVIVTASAYDNVTPEIPSSYTFYTNLMEKKTPTYWFAVINGTPTQNRNLILASMDRSPWVEPVERRITIARLEYNLSAGPSATDPMVYGLLTSPLPQGAYLSVSTTSNTTGNVTFVAVSGSRFLGLMVYRDEQGGYLKGVLIGNTTPGVVRRFYSGTNSSILIPLKDIFGEESNVVIGLWLYSLDGWDRSEVSIDIMPSIEWSLEPKAEQAFVKLTVWDDS
ncbi:hypothetical protein [Thermococcus gorgonarius]|uniref:Uncharacterized protein n=1 Tax=Thermococcus gorgonarius TaxID=71997 RepID=A0A2Z2M6F0_THEGO|nr:hypothetical protein [Thermococcus gorgonarius]ASJ01186.1 hypothetical protein A3K92_06665 [Thermococcus gorgonarius]